MSKISNFFKKILNITITEETTTTTNPPFLKRGRSTTITNLDFNPTVNALLTKNLYYNRVPGLKLGAHFAKTIIDITLAFLGFPAFYSKSKVSKFWVKWIDFYNKSLITQKQNIEKIANRDGTCWIFPRWDSSSGVVVWDFLPEAYELRYGDNKKLIGVSFREAVTYRDDTGAAKIKETITLYTESKIKITTAGQTKTFINKSGIPPINFINNGEPKDQEGSSDLEVIYPLLQVYSQLTTKKIETLLNHSPKLIQTVLDMEQWMSNNGLEPSSLEEISIESIDFIINGVNPDTGFSDKTEYLVPTALIEVYESALKTAFHNMIQGSGGLPEIALGLKTEGNHATTAEQFAIMVAFVDLKRDCYRGPYERLMNATLKITGEANFRNFDFEIDQNWSDLDMVSDLEKSTIFSNYAGAISSLTASGWWGPESTHKLLRPILGDKIFSEFEKFLNDMNYKKEVPADEPAAK